MLVDSCWSCNIALHVEWLVWQWLTVTYRYMAFAYTYMYILQMHELLALFL